MSFTSELLPEPETPVTQTNTPSGISTSMFLRLLCVAPRTTSLASPTGRRRAGISIRRRPERYCPVMLFGSAITWSTGPAATTCPPRTPGPGPKSTMWSAARIVSSSCSTTITVLPWSRSRAERFQQAVVVAGVQADRRLVEDVEHAHQSAADLPGQPDALHLAAGERRRGAIEGEIFQAHVLEESAAGRESP